MGTAEEIFNNIIRWGQQEEPVRALVLTGSRAHSEPPDDLADFDISVFAETCEPYIEKDNWLAGIGEVWVYIPEEYEEGCEVIPTRLVIYEGGFKVDFAFHNTAMFSKVTWDGCYKVLLDKDDLTANMKGRAQARQPSPPTEKDFMDLVREFWFEAYHVAKYLKRNELWMAKFRDYTTKELLLKMIEWHAQANNHWNLDTYYQGKRLKFWAETSVWEDMHQTFPRFNEKESWTALLSTLDLFRRLAIETSDMLGYAYPQDVDRNITRFVLRLKEYRTI